MRTQIQHNIKHRAVATLFPAVRVLERKARALLLRMQISLGFHASNHEIAKILATINSTTTNKNMPNNNNNNKNTLIYGDSVARFGFGSIMSRRAHNHRPSKSTGELSNYAHRIVIVCLDWSNTYRDDARSRDPLRCARACLPNRTGVNVAESARSAPHRRRRRRRRRRGRTRRTHSRAQLSTASRACSICGETSGHGANQQNGRRFHT